MSNKKKTILFICAIPRYDLYNRQSAIDSILCSILTSLKKDYCIFVNGIPFSDERAAQINKNSVVALSGSNLLSKIIPRRVKEYIKLKKIRENNDSFVRTLCSGEPPDVVFELLKYGSDVGKRIAEKFKVPLVLYYDSPITHQFKDVYGFNPSKRVINNERVSVSFASVIIAYSNPVVTYIKDNLCLSGKTPQFRVFQTLDYSRLLTESKKIVDESITIGFVGSFMKWHRVDMLVRVVHKLINNGYNVKLLLVGAGEKYQEIISQINQLEMKDNVKLTGFIDGEELLQYKKQINIGVMPGSNWYGIPTKVFEYGALGIPSVAPETPTIKDIFTDKENITLFENNNENSLYEAMKLLVTNKDIAENTGSAIQKMITSNYNQTIAYAFYDELFSNL